MVLELKKKFLSWNRQKVRLFLCTKTIFFLVFEILQQGIGQIGRIYQKYRNIYILLKTPPSENPAISGPKVTENKEQE